jgi:serine/threonine-protein kinase
MVDEETHDSLPRLLGGRYRLEAQLGRGGMGVVYRATDLTMHRSVAVKLIRGSAGVELDEEVAGRFLREAKNTARVQHEHIIEVYDLGRSAEGDLFFVMELLEGESLSARLRRDGRLSARETVDIGVQICAALQVAHAAGIIHRDLKPANVMLVRRAGRDDFVKVLDFGVAKSYSPDQQTQLTHTGMLVGTVEYMAPEQIMGRSVDGRTDLYSLGIVLYRMLAGKAPFKDGGVPALIHSHLNVTPKPILDIAPDVPRSLERVVQRALAKRPEDRYASMIELAGALEASVAPDDLGLMSLEYRGEESADPYDAGDRTEIARPARAGAGGQAFEDATIRIDRPPSTGSVEVGAAAARRPAGPPVAPVAPVAAVAPVAPQPNLDETALLVRSDESTAKRAIPEEIARRERSAARTCAMCQTLNPPHARACTACGVSLAAEDQEAVRARVTAPRTAHLAAPQMPPPISGAYASGAGAAQTPQHGAPGPFAPTPGQGVPNLPPWGPMPAPARARPPSMWERFLSWSGLAPRR